MPDVQFNKWNPVAGNKEVAVSEDGNFRVARMPDWQFTISYRAVPNQPKPPGRIWIDVEGDFDTLDEAVEQASKELERMKKAQPSGL